MKLHWSPRSPFVRKVMIFAHETGLAEAFERVRSVVAMRKPNAALMLDNPLGKLPTLVLDDGRALFDSVVICEYLDSRIRLAFRAPAHRRVVRQTIAAALGADDRAGRRSIKEKPWRTTTPNSRWRSTDT